MRPESAVRGAWVGLVGEPANIEQQDPRSIEALLEEYGGTAGIAEAAGFGTAAEARAAGPDAVRRRENFMRDLRRYRQGTRSPSKEFRELFNLEPSEPRPRTLAEVVTLAERWGVTFAGFATVWISEDEVEREWPEPGWWISPAVMRDVGAGWAYGGLGTAIIEAGPRGTLEAWADPTDQFAAAMSTAYLGGPGMVLADVEELTLQLGRVEGSQAIEVGDMAGLEAAGWPRVRRS